MFVQTMFGTTLKSIKCGTGTVEQSTLVLYIINVVIRVQREECTYFDLCDYNLFLCTQYFIVQEKRAQMNIILFYYCGYGERCSFEI